MHMSEFMRLIVFFDIPVVKKEDRIAATKFRKFLIDDGYYMVQFSVYARLCNTIENVQKHEMRLKNNLPYVGSVRSMVVTEKQYSTMNILVGKKRKKENKIAENQISFF